MGWKPAGWLFRAGLNRSSRSAGGQQPFGWYEPGGGHPSLFPSLVPLPGCNQQHSCCTTASGWKSSSREQTKMYQPNGVIFFLMLLAGVGGPAGSIEAVFSSCVVLLSGVGGPAGSVKVVFSSCVVLLSGEDILSYLAPIARCIAVQLLHARCIAASISIQSIHFHVCAPPLLCFVVYSCVSIDLMKVCRFMYWLIRLSWES